MNGESGDTGGNSANYYFLFSFYFLLSVTFYFSACGVSQQAHILAMQTTMVF